MKKIHITQIRSTINRPKYQKKIIDILKLGKINKSRTLRVTPQIMGMICKVNHLLNIKINYEVE